jgi:micrococcal nuclease
MMSRNFILSVFLLFACSQEPLFAETSYHVKWVNDGDTIVLQDGRHVRLIGINAPEIQHEDQKAEPYGDKAKSFNMKLVYRKKVRLEFDREKKDHYRRLLAYVFLKDGVFVNAKLLTVGYAYYLHHRPNLKYSSVLLASQREAMRAETGLWSNWREPEAAYIGNKRSRRFHLPTCPFAKKIKRKNRIFFSKKWDAFWAGYAPAKKCVAGGLRDLGIGE